MSTDNASVFKKEVLDKYLTELAKEYRKLVGKSMPAEIVLVGGAAVIEGYGFRDMTTDVDAVISAASAMKDAIDRVGDRFDLPRGWLNADFRTTGSYSEKLIRYSAFYRTFCGVLNVRAVTGEYLVAMKLRAFRQFKNDVSDVIGILAEHGKRGDAITLERVENAVAELYGGWDGFPAGAHEFITGAISGGDYESVYALVRQNERDARELLVDFDAAYPGALNADNAAAVLKKLREKK